MDNWTVDPYKSWTPRTDAAHTVSPGFSSPWLTPAPSTTSGYQSEDLPQGYIDIEKMMRDAIMWVNNEDIPDDNKVHELAKELNDALDSL